MKNLEQLAENVKNKGDSDRLRYISIPVNDGNHMIYDREHNFYINPRTNEVFYTLE